MQLIIKNKLYTRTQLLDTAHTHKFTAHTRDATMFSVGKLRKFVPGFAKKIHFFMGCYTNF